MHCIHMYYMYYTCVCTEHELVVTQSPLAHAPPHYLWIILINCRQKKKEVAFGIGLYMYCA